jgi:hypothetical protein
MSKKLGIIQSRGLGDIVIALPIARWYHNQGWEIYWPIADEFMSSMTQGVPWIKWVPLTVDHNRYFYETPMERLKNFKCDEIIPLYQALSTHPEFSAVKYFQHTKFDQYKYIRAGVPFLEKWNLAPCIVRDPQREQALYDQLITNPNYVAVHLEGSDHTARWNPEMVPADWQIVYINNQTDSIFDWLKILEGAQSLVMVDSVFSNLVDQLGIGEDRYFIVRSHIGLTPVQGQDWTWLD